MRNDIKEYLASDETGFYESNYGTEKNPVYIIIFKKKMS